MPFTLQVIVSDVSQQIVKQAAAEGVVGDMSRRPNSNPTGQIRPAQLSQSTCHSQRSSTSTAE
jgi:hypothetical protein